MPSHEYTAQQALELLLKKVAARDEELARILRAVVDAGKDVQTSEPNGRGRKPREYRRTVPYSYEEAIEVALAGLEAYFVAQPLFRNSCTANFLRAAIGMPRPLILRTTSADKVAFDVKSVGQDKEIQIELRTETQLLPETQALQRTDDVYQLKPVGSDEVHAEQEMMSRLRQLLSFKE